MPFDPHAINAGLPATFDVVHATDALELGAKSRISERLPPSGRLYNYRLRDGGLWHKRFDQPIFSVATRRAGSIVVSFGAGRFATEVTLDGEEGDLFCATMPLRGELTLTLDGEGMTGTEACGLMFRSGPRTRLLMSDGSIGANVFFKAVDIEKALESTLDQRLRKPLEFSPRLDWGGGLLASLKRQLDCVLEEFQRPDGVASNPVALASTTDLLMTLLLRAARHTYSDQMELGPKGAIPSYVRRAEDFMRAHSAEPIRIVQVAAAAGCSVRTLSGVFQDFRGTTPLGALHAIRLERVHEDLVAGAAGASIATVARRYGFTNLARFGAAFRRRFKETPSGLLRRMSRS